MRSAFAVFLRGFTLPFGATTGVRIELDGTTGEIKFYDADNHLVGLLSPGLWSIGDLDAPGGRITLDPAGGLRFRSDDDVLVSILDQQGYSLRDATSGLVVAELRAGSLRLVDPDGADDIEMTTASTPTMPNPAYRSLPEPDPGSSLIIPVAPGFSVPPDDLELGHVAAWLAGVSQSAGTTPPSGWTERSDVTTAGLGPSTLSCSVATQHPATGSGATFTSSASNWQSAVGTHVIVRGSGPVSPSFRSVSGTSMSTTDTTANFDIPTPAGVIEGNAMVAFVTIGVAGGSVPRGWTTPSGWVFLGANFLIRGAGPTLSTLAVGVWAKLAGPSEPASSVVTIDLGPGQKTLQATVVAIQDVFLIDGGAHIRIAGHPIRRLLASSELTAPNATLCDFTDIPGGFDHLEVVYDCWSDRSTDALRNIRWRFNNDAGAGNYHWRVDRTAGPTQTLNTDRIILGAVNGANINHRSGGQFNIIDYARPWQRMVLGESFFITAGVLNSETSRSMWLNTTDPINRVTASIDSGTTLFDAGSKVFLYGY